MATVEIAGRRVGDDNPCFIVAEAGVAHFGSLDVARTLVDMAVEAKADAVKFQIFQTNRLVSGVATDWVKRLKTKELPPEAFAEIKTYCEGRGILFFATAHEPYSADFLDELGVPLLKVGSGEVGNTAFIRHLARKGKPLIISTGLHDDAAIRNVLDAARAEGCDQIVLLHCVTAYPTPYDQANLRAIPWMRDRYSVPVGYSDHTEGFVVPMAASALGACVIEKHISVDKRILGSQDCRVACDRADLIAMVSGIRQIEAALGSGEKVVSEAAGKALAWARKSLVARRPLPVGTALTMEDLDFKRPGTGIPPDDVANALGKKLARAKQPDDVISWEDLA